MSDHQIPAVQERNARILAFIIEAPDTPIAVICSKFGVTRGIVAKIRDEADVAACAVRGPRPAGEQEMLSPLHHQVGVEIFHHRTFTLRQEVTQAAFAFKVSRYQLSLAERGAFNFTLSQLQHIASELGVTLVELLTPKARGFGAVTNKSLAVSA
jgi:hypothetical protein